MANNRKSKRKFWLWIGLAAVVIAAGLVVAVKASGNTTKFEPSQLAKAQRGDIARSVVATGKITPITQVIVKSKASGIVTKLDVTGEDDTVHG
ncbi:efflux RND transporter periplasmic adaptor subunit [Edaphobacter sp.]|uniref:efflux RND transporter periplasmic adaptor subunit n=1 Tax=Edaphobacter sp. TaxID=1934404 RepID=UPI002DB8145E|nr:efflux RND transporter periplasmic adaptor subunit [Edaphobacter sp.]HEU5342657.1 efflux RND transporter periplasmic adaptor subunit [Edaphobacter sp.]